MPGIFIIKTGHTKLEPLLEFHQNLQYLSVVIGKEKSAYVRVILSIQPIQYGVKNYKSLQSQMKQNPFFIIDLFKVD